MKAVQLRSKLCAFTVFLFASAACSPLAAQASATPFTVYDNTSFPNSTSVFDPAGTLRATVMYSQSSWPGSCTSTGCPNAPTETEFKQDVTAYVKEFGTSNVIVFDYENLVINSESSTGAANNAVALFQQMIAWTRQVYPNAKIGMYDYDYSSSYAPNSSNGYNSIRAQLFNGSANSFDFFAPTMYQRWSNHTTWDQNLAQAIINDSAVNHSNGLNLPIYPYFSPNVSGNPSGSLLADSEFQAELTDLTACSQISSSGCQAVLTTVSPVTGDCTASGSGYSCSPVLGGLLWTGGSSNVSATAPWVLDVLALLSAPVSANGTYEIMSAGQNGACLDGNTGTGTVVADTCVQSASQEWVFSATADGTYAIQNYGFQQTNLGTGNNDDWNDSDSTLQLASASSGQMVTAGQQWQVASLRNGNYEFVEVGDYATQGNTDSEECLTAGAGGLTTSICNGSQGQIFRMAFVVGTGAQGLGDVADAYLNSGTYAANNYGTNSYVLVENSSANYTRKFYLQFNVSGITQTITQATLYIVPITVVGTDTDAAFLVDGDTWTQTGITWNNAPPFSTTQLATWSVSASSVGYPILSDITAAAAAAQSSGGLLSIGIDAPSTSNYVAYGSSRNGTAANRPMLVISVQ